MPELIRLIGDSGGFGIARDLWGNAEDAQDQQVVFEADKPVGSDEMNLLQQVGEERMRAFAEGIMSDGLAWGGLFHYTDQDDTPLTNGFYMDMAFWVIDHLPFITSDSRNNGGDHDLRQAIKITLPSPPGGSTPRVDEVFLEFWLEEVAPLGQTNASTAAYERGGVGNLDTPEGNDIQNFYFRSETTRRVQLRWRIRVVANADSPEGLPAWGAIPSNPEALTYAPMPFSVAITYTDPIVYRAGGVDATNHVHDRGLADQASILGSVNGFSYAIHLASVTRRPGDTVVRPGDVIKGPPPAELHLRVPRQNIFPPIPEILPGATVYPVLLSYEGVAGDSTTGSGQTVNHLDAQSLAVSFIIPRPSGSPLNTVTLSRIELSLGREGTGCNLTIDLVADASGPTGAVLASFIIPATWLLDAPRPISIPMGVEIVYGGKYWIRAHRASVGGNSVVWEGEPLSNQNRARSKATTDPALTSWSTNIPPLHMSAYSGNDGTMRNVIEGTEPFVEVTLVDYRGDDVSLIGEAHYDQHGVLTESNLAEVVRDPSGDAIVALRQLN